MLSVPQRRMLVLAALVSGLACAESNRAGESTWTLVSDVRIGGEDPEFQFTEISAVIPYDSVVFVTQRSDQVIRAYDLEGRFVRSIGRSGSGPGEFLGSAWKVGLLDDTLWVIDEGRRISYFTPEGDLLETTTYGDPRPVTGTSGAYFFEQPQVLTAGAGAVGFGSYAESQRAAGLIPRMPILSFTRDGKTVDTLAWTSTENGTVTVSRGPYRSQPFSDEPLITYSPNGDRVLIVDRTAPREVEGATFRVSAVAAQGDTLWSREYSYVPKPLDPQTVDSVRNWMRAKYKGWVSPTEVDRALFIPKFENTVTSIVFGVDKRTWLRREGSDSLVTYTVLDMTGVEMASVVVSRKVQLLWASATHVWGSELDADDVPTLVRFRIDTRNGNTGTR